MWLFKLGRCIVCDAQASRVIIYTGNRCYLDTADVFGGDNEHGKESVILPRSRFIAM